MHQDLESMLNEWLTDQMNILVCTQSSKVSSIITSSIGRYPSISLHNAATEKALEVYYRQSTFWHCIIVDSSISFSEKLFDFIENISKWVPVVLLSNSLPVKILEDWCVEKVDDKKYCYLKNNTYRKGCIVELTERVDLKKILSLTVASSLKKIFYNTVPDRRAENLLSVLFKENPVTVKEWADSYGISPRKIQRLISYYSKKTPKRIVSLYHVFRIAFSMIDNTGNFNCEIFGKHEIEENHKKRFMEYALSRRSTILKIT